MKRVSIYSRAVDVTICIRTRNEEQLLGRTLEAVFSQRTRLSYEVCILDSGSVDRTIEIGKRFPARILKFPPQLFTYSSSLNAGVTLARGTYFVALSGHAAPTDTDWLGELIEPLLKNEKTGVSFSRQLPWDDASVPERRALAREFPETGSTVTPEAFSAAVARGDSPYELARCSNASGAFRAELLRKFPFRNVPFSEDRCAAVELLTAGYSIEYAPGSKVFHSHEPSFVDFRAVARRATSARHAIDAFGRRLSAYEKTSVTPPPLCSAAIKVPLLAGYVPLTLLGTLVRRRPHWRREARWVLASMGTTIGKVQGVCAARSHSFEIPPPIASPDAILAALEEAA